jgi:TIR domain/Pentapeptide repeats (8 copies)
MIEMANQEQVERLTHSVKEWNQWRQEFPDIRPDLSDTDLSRANLSYADLSNASLFDAKLFSTNFSSANLSSTSLNATNLFHANFCDANLSYASLSYAYLSNANLSNVNFTGSHFYATCFAWVDLSNVKGLETAIHGNRSSVDINSVILPRDEQTRLHFLRGVGFTETQIEYLPSFLTPRPIKYCSLFISYAHQDEILAQQLHAHLRKNDVPCWFAPHDLQPGNYFREGIDQALHAQDKVLLLLSEHSVKSGWVRYEVELTLARENRQQREILFPVRLDDAIFQCAAGWAISLQETRHIGNFTSWQDDGAYQQAFTTLLRHLKVTAPPTL